MSCLESSPWLRILSSISWRRDSFNILGSARGLPVSPVHSETGVSAVQLRFNVRRSPSLPNDVAVRLMRLAGKRLTKEGVIVIVAQQHRDQTRNRADARERLFELIRQAAVRPVPRRATKVPKAQKRKRVEGKKHRGHIKSLRGGKPGLE